MASMRQRIIDRLCAIRLRIETKLASLEVESKSANSRQLALAGWQKLEEGAWASALALGKKSMAKGGYSTLAAEVVAIALEREERWASCIEFVSTIEVTEQYCDDFFVSYLRSLIHEHFFAEAHEAIKAYNKDKLIHPEIMYCRAVVYYELGEVDEAVTILADLLGRSSDFDFVLLKAHCHFKIGDFKQASKLYEQAVRLEPDAQVALSGLKQCRTRID